MNSLVEGLTKKYPNIEFRFLNVDGSNQSAISHASELGVQYVPTFVFVNGDGTVSTKLIGSQSGEALEEALKELE